MRVLGVDPGRKRTGLALSDRSRTLATPYRTIQRGDVLEELVGVIRTLAGEEDGLATVVIGLPLSLEGRPTEETERARRLADALRGRVDIQVVLQDERLTSREAESRLAIREKDWRVRKARLDAAAAAIVLQEYLDANGPPASEHEGPTLLKPDHPRD